MHEYGLTNLKQYPTVSQSNQRKSSGPTHLRAISMPIILRPVTPQPLMLRARVMQHPLLLDMGNYGNVSLPLQLE